MSYPLPAAVMMMKQRLEERIAVAATADVGAEIKERRNRIICLIESKGEKTYSPRHKTRQGCMSHVLPLVSVCMTVTVCALEDSVIYSILHIQGNSGGRLPELG